MTALLACLSFFELLKLASVPQTWVIYILLLSFSAGPIATDLATVEAPALEGHAPGSPSRQAEVGGQGQARGMELGDTRAAPRPPGAHVQAVRVDSQG